MEKEFEYYIGIDGGGTNCRAILSDKSGNIIGRGQSGATNIRLGIDNAWTQIIDAIGQCLEQAGLDNQIFENSSLGLGLAGISNLTDANSFLEFGPKFGDVRIASDAHIACLGAFGGENGAILISGTGSIGYALIHGRPHTVGGWGFEVSDDGSAAALGRQALRACLLAHDKIGRSSPLTKALMNRFGGTPADIVKWVTSAKPKDYGLLAPMVLDYADDGDAVAVILANEAAVDLGRIIARLHEIGAPKICMFGGMAQRLSPWLAPWTKILLAEPKQDALFGALLLAQGASDGLSIETEAAEEDRPWRKTKMYTEAKSSGQGVRQFLDQNLEKIAELAQYLRQLRPGFVVTVGRGSSDHAATYAKYLIETKLGIPTSSAALATASLYSTTLQETPSVCIAISQSGRSSDLLSSVEAYKKSGACIIAFVNDEASPLYKMADFAFGLKVGVEESVAATKSYIASLVACAALVGFWSSDKKLIEHVKLIPQRIEEAFASNWQNVCDELIEANSLFVLGRSYSLAAAQEAALKFKETCGLHAEAFSSAEVKHGPKAIIREGFPILGFATSDGAGANLMNVCDEFAGFGAKVWVAGSNPFDNAKFKSLEFNGDIPELEPIFMISAFYRMAAQLSILRGLNPDTPPYLQKVTDTI